MHTNSEYSPRIVGIGLLLCASIEIVEVSGCKKKANAFYVVDALGAIS
jgi:hypothetical protein